MSTAPSLARMTDAHHCNLVVDKQVQVGRRLVSSNITAGSITSEVVSVGTLMYETLDPPIVIPPPPSSSLGYGIFIDTSGSTGFASLGSGDISPIIALGTSYNTPSAPGSASPLSWVAGSTSGTSISGQSLQIDRTGVWKIDVDFNFANTDTNSNSEWLRPAIGVNGATPLIYQSTTRPNSVFGATDFYTHISTILSLSGGDTLEFYAQCHPTPLGEYDEFWTNSPLRVTLQQIE